MMCIVPDAEHRENEAGSPWYIFNDFVVRNVPEEEALSFPDRWKVPWVLAVQYSEILIITIGSGRPAF